MGTREQLRFLVIIPPRIDLMRSAPLSGVKRGLQQASIRPRGSPRPFFLDARVSDSRYELVDFPAPITVLENWIERRLKRESLKRDSAQATKLEQDELARFVRMLEWWAEDELRAPEFRDRVQVRRFRPDDAELTWLGPAWSG